MTQTDSPSTVLTLEPASGAATPTGTEAILAFARRLPNAPGVYRMIDAAGTVLYVGKASSLKKRVQSYTRIANQSARIMRMIQATSTMEFVTTRTETEALLLEANLIKRLRPRFNVLLRDDKSFPYILITGDHEAPQIVKHRGAHDRKGSYFGPFASAGAVDRTINAMERAFLLRSCSDGVYESRTRPCLLFQIKRCSAPCTGEISLADYAGLVCEAKGFLSGRSQSVRRELAAAMEAASARLDFEQAAAYRDRLAALSHVQGHQGINPQRVGEADVFACYQEGGQTCVQVFFFRTGQNWGNRAYFPRADRSLGPGEVLGAFLAQFYDDKQPPKLILISHEVEDQALLEEALGERSGHRVAVSVPQRGEKRDLVDHALTNAREALGRRLAESATQRALLAGLCEAFGLPHPPRRIEVYDNSHIMGTDAVGAMIVAGPEGFVKNQYRKFNIRSADLTPGDDFGMMREVLRRRFARLIRESPRPNLLGNAGVDLTAASSAESPEAGAAAPRRNGNWGVTSPRRGQGQGEGGLASVGSEPPRPPPRADLSPPGRGDGGPDTDHDPEIEPPPLEGDPGDADEEDTAHLSPAWPDLVLIDGGQGQLTAARETLAELGLHDVAIVGIAKGPDRDAGLEKFFVPGRDSFMLQPRDPVLYFVQRLRDEAHRFAVGSHRARRKTQMSRNPLDEIAGIGPMRKRALLRHFGTAKAIGRAGMPDLLAVPGISEQLARAIYDHFNGGE